MTGAGPAPPERDTYTGERRVTLDLDDADGLDAVRGVKMLRDAGCYDVECRVSSGGGGFHVRGWVDADRFTEADTERLRLAHGDDIRRVDLDRKHIIKPEQILFSAKGSAEAGPWRSDPWLAVDDMRENGRLDL